MQNVLKWFHEASDFRAAADAVHPLNFQDGNQITGSLYLNEVDRVCRHRLSKRASAFDVGIYGLGALHETYSGPATFAGGFLCVIVGHYVFFRVLVYGCTAACAVVGVVCVCECAGVCQSVTACDCNIRPHCQNPRIMPPLSLEPALSHN